MEILMALNKAITISCYQPSRSDVNRDVWKMDPGRLLVPIWYFLSWRRAYCKDDCGAPLHCPTPMFRNMPNETWTQANWRKFIVMSRVDHIFERRLYYCPWLRISLIGQFCPLHPRSAGFIGLLSPEGSGYTRWSRQMCAMRLEEKSRHPNFALVWVKSLDKVSCLGRRIWVCWWNVMWQLMWWRCILIVTPCVCTVNTCWLRFPYLPCRFPCENSIHSMLLKPLFLCSFLGIRDFSPLLWPSLDPNIYCVCLL